MLIAVIFTFCAGVHAALAQPATNVPRVGYIQTATAEEQEPLTRAFESALRDLGSVHGRNIIIERRFAAGKRVELLKSAIPRAARVAVLWNPLPPAADAYRRAVEAAAVRLGLNVRSIAVRGRDEFERAFDAMSRDRVEAVIILPDPIFFTARTQVIALTTKHRLPGVFHAREFVELGGLMSYGSNLASQFRRAATYVDKILKGMKAAELPIEQAATLELVINRSTAQALGVVIPPPLMLQADHIVD